MKEIYKNNEANYPRHKTDKFFADYNNKYKYSGIIDNTFAFIRDFQLMSAGLWERFVRQFREDADFDAGWRGEYWGKMMRGACFVYSYTKDEKLLEILTKTVNDMMESSDEDGRISSYGKNHEFDGWDIWCRKYVLLGMQYFLEICEDEKLKKRIVSSMTAQVDYIISCVGQEDGKREITSCTRHWRGANSSSLLEPVIRLYSITGEKRFFDFAEYIVSRGVTDVEDLFELAYKNELYPYQYPVTKAYEITSCFEGLLEFYRITGIEKYKQAVINYADKVLETDFTVIGCAGCTHELFDHSTVRQANTTNGKIMQETCVTVTLMKFFYQLNLLTGDSEYADAFETSLYNAYLGAVNTNKVVEPSILKEHPDWSIEPLPFDSYSPLTAGTRGNGIGGLRLMSDNHYYGCCACIGSAGIGLVPKMQLLLTENGFAFNLYINGSVETVSPNGKKTVFKTVTDYPRTGEVGITVETETEDEFELLLRNPDWSGETKIFVNGIEIKTEAGYTVIKRVWKNRDSIRIIFDMRTKVIYPKAYGSQVLMNKVIWGKNYIVPTFDEEDPDAKKHIALKRGPVVLAEDARLGCSVDEPVDILTDNGFVNAKLTDGKNSKFDNLVEVTVPLKNGEEMTLTDYSSAGKTWDEKSKMAAWISVM